MKEALLILLGVFLSEVHGHGGMYYPYTWTAKTTPSVDRPPKKFRFMDLPIPADHCEGILDGPNIIGSGDCRFKIHNGLSEWYTNNTVIPGNATLPMDMFDDGKPAGWVLKNPWAAPGSAPVYGEGCGVNGGNPDGCGKGNVYGSCCGRTCGGYEGGKPAIEHYQDGLFDNAPVTEWVRGQPAEVYWLQQADHRGGYAYRLCKVPEEGMSGITEACFEDGHLDFYGDTAWIYYKSNKNFNSEKWTAIDAVRTREGTYPEGSEWAKVALPIPTENGANWAFKDLVQVPETIPAGDYVLSFRWECQYSAQIWNSCANIKVV